MQHFEHLNVWIFLMWLNEKKKCKCEKQHEYLPNNLDEGSLEMLHGYFESYKKKTMY